VAILKDDVVVVIAGDDRGKSGKVLEVFRKENKVIVEGINVKKKHKKADREGKNGGILDLPVAVHISNVKLEGKAKAAPTKKAAAKKKK